MGEIFGMAGQLGAAAMSAAAITDATQMQVDALNKQKQWVYDNLNPSTINAQATSADIQQAQARLALQRSIDPSLANIRGTSQQDMASVLSSLMAQDSQAKQVADAATQQALSGGADTQQMKAQLIDAALGQIHQGATLPPDVQAQLVQAGLEQAGMVTQNASAKGIGGQVTRSLIGKEALNLQFQRQQQAASLMTAAQNLDSQRQSILQGLFPSLQASQLNQLSAAGGALGTSNSMLPNAGLSGSDIANLWLARTGATNQLAQSAANAQAAGGMGAAQAWGNGIGAATGYGARALPSVQQAWPAVSGWLGGGNSGGGYSGGPSGTGSPLLDYVMSGP